jgi:hypothetical protein
MNTFRKSLMAVVLVAQLGACAGRDPQMTATVQPQDMASDCPAITAQITANNTRLMSLKTEQGNTQGGNIALAVVGGLLFWPALFAMDLKGAAGKEIESLNQRQGYLQQLAAQKGCPPISTEGWGR